MQKGNEVKWPCTLLAGLWRECLSCGLARARHEPGLQLWTRSCQFCVDCWQRNWLMLDGSTFASHAPALDEHPAVDAWQDYPPAAVAWPCLPVLFQQQSSVLLRWLGMGAKAKWWACRHQEWGYKYHNDGENVSTRNLTFYQILYVWKSTSCPSTELNGQFVCIIFKIKLYGALF